MWCTYDTHDPTESAEIIVRPNRDSCQLIYYSSPVRQLVTENFFLNVQDGSVIPRVIFDTIRDALTVYDQESIVELTDCI